MARNEPAGPLAGWFALLFLASSPFSACLDRTDPLPTEPITFGDVVKDAWGASGGRSTQFVWRGNVTAQEATAGFTLPSLPYVVTVDGQASPGWAVLWMNKTIRVNGQQVYGLIKSFESSSWMADGVYQSNASVGDPHPDHPDDAKRFQILAVNEVVVTVQLTLVVREPGSNLFSFEMGPGRVFRR